MPNVDEKSPPDNWVKLHAAAMDALVRGSAFAPDYQPYPGDHPCSICGSQLAFVAVGWPRDPKWFCKKHLEEHLCQTTQPIQSKLSKLSAGQEPNYGEKPSSATGSERQLTLFKNGP